MLSFVIFEVLHSRTFKEWRCENYFPEDPQYHKDRPPTLPFPET